jgi:hypothetical protein
MEFETRERATVRATPLPPRASAAPAASPASPTPPPPDPTPASPSPTPAQPFPPLPPCLARCGQALWSVPRRLQGIPAPPSIGSRAQKKTMRDVVVRRSRPSVVACSRGSAGRGTKAACGSAHHVVGKENAPDKAVGVIHVQFHRARGPGIQRTIR